jgi:hypothetical protein
MRTKEEGKKNEEKRKEERIFICCLPLLLFFGLFCKVKSVCISNENNEIKKEKKRARRILMF